MHGERIQVSQSNLFEAPMIILEGGLKIRLSCEKEAGLRA